MWKTKEIFSDRYFQKADKVFFHDKYVKFLFLWAIPKSLYPNYFTVFRFLAAPVVAYLMYFDHYAIGLISFLVVASTDFIDGSLARTRNQITDWGKIYDPLADKILIGCAVFTIILRYVDFWTAIIIVLLEVIIIVSAYRRKHIGGEIQANIWGKVKMLLQTSGVIILLLSVVFDVSQLLPLASGVLYLAIAFAIVSLLTYGI